MSSLPDRNQRLRRGFALTCPESLEVRALLAAVTVDVGQVVRAVDPQLVGVNTAWWDTSLNTSQTQQMVQAAGLNLFRLPGGSSSMISTSMPRLRIRAREPFRAWPASLPR